METNDKIGELIKHLKGKQLEEKKGTKKICCYCEEEYYTFRPDISRYCCPTHRVQDWRRKKLLKQKFVTRNNEEGVVKQEFN